MSQQLVLSINNAADHFRWCWLQDGQPQSSAAGNLEALREAIGTLNRQVWLLLPGIKVVTRELEYTEKEKKHLRNLVPFQLEDSVVGDVDNLHFALGNAAQGKVAVSYTDKAWLRDIFKQLTDIGLEITRCWSAPTLLPLTAPESADDVIAIQHEPDVDELDTDIESLKPRATWVVALQDGAVNLRVNEQRGFTLPQGHFIIALAMFLKDQGLDDNNLPELVLRATSEEELVTLKSLLPENLAAQVRSQYVVDEWQLDFDSAAIDLCQAEFSQRLPFERWLKMWRGVAILAAVTLLVYVGVLWFHTYKLDKENLTIRQQTEAVFRKVVPHGPSDSPDTKLRTRLKNLQPSVQTGSVVALLAGVFPIVSSNSDITLKMISYTGDNGELTINLQAHAFTSIDNLQKALEAQGYKAELLSSSVQGDLNMARLKLSKPAN